MRSVLRHATLPFASLAACFAAFIGLGIGEPRAEQVTFFAAASTADAVNAVTARYAATVPGEGPDGPVVRPVFAASSTLAKQIVQGAPAQLFLSASNEWMDYLERRHAIDPASRVDLLGNRLVLVTPADSKLSLAIAPGFPLARVLDGGWLAIGDPAHVPGGAYAKAAQVCVNQRCIDFDESVPSLCVSTSRILKERQRRTFATQSFGNQRFRNRFHRWTSQ